MDGTRCVWLLAVMLTATAAGAMVGHTLLVGRFLNWMLGPEGADRFCEAYPAFIRAEKPQRLFDNLFTVAILVTTGFNGLLYISERLTVLPLVAMASQWAFVAIFFGTGFAKLERELFLEGKTSSGRVERFLAWNLPLCILSSVLFLSSLLCLVLSRI